MKKVGKNKKVIAVMVMGLLAILLAASGVIAVPFDGLHPVASKINYQGQLTDLSTGDPLDGTYTMRFQLYDDATAGTLLWDSGGQSVDVDNGLFNVKLDVDQSDFNGQGLWLEVRVEGETFGPRQEILPVPYALSLKPGAEIKGETDNTIVKAENIGEGDGVSGIASWYDSIGVYGQSGFGTGVRGEGEVGVSGESSLGPGVQGKGSVGVYGISDSGTGVCGYSTSGTAIFAAGTGVIESTADSYIFISGYEFIKNVNTDSTRWDCLGNGAVKIWRGATAGNKFIYIPVTVPGVLYGQNVKVESITIYYKCQDGTKNYIGNTCLWKQTSATNYVELVTDYTHRTSNSATSYTLPLTTNNTLSSNQGILSLHMGLDFDDDVNYIQLGGVRLRLSHHS